MIHHHVCVYSTSKCCTNPCLQLDLDYMNICCDGTAHSEPFNLQDHLLGPIFAEQLKWKNIENGLESAEDEDDEDAEGSSNDED